MWTFPVHGDALVPTQKPIGLISSFVSDFTQPQETILDPFLGSGTTGVAAIQQGRKFVGIEANPAHFDIACKRIEQAAEQGKLFEDVKPTPTQSSFL